MYQLMSTVNLPGSKIFGKHIMMHSCTQQKDFSLAKYFQKHLSNDDRKHGFVDQGKGIKRASKTNWKDREYHVQDNSDVAHKDVKTYCDTNPFPELTFFGYHPKPHVARGLFKNYHICFDPNLGHGICEIHRIPCACVACISMPDQPWIFVVRSTKQARYQAVVNCTYWSVLSPYNNWNIIHLTPKSIPCEAFDEINQVVLDGISENMASLVQLGMYGAINIDDTKTNKLYVIQFLSGAYTLQILSRAVTWTVPAPVARGHHGPLNTANCPI